MKRQTCWFKNGFSAWTGWVFGFGAGQAGETYRLAGQTDRKTCAAQTSAACLLVSFLCAQLILNSFWTGSNSTFHCVLLYGQTYYLSKNMVTAISFPGEEGTWCGSFPTQAGLPPLAGHGDRQLGRGFPQKWLPHLEKEQKKTVTGTGWRETMACCMAPSSGLHFYYQEEGHAVVGQQEEETPSQIHNHACCRLAGLGSDRWHTMLFSQANMLCFSSTFSPTSSPLPTLFVR